MDGGESPPPVVGRFLKVLLPGFQTALKLPPPFTRMLSDTDLNSKRALLKTSKGSWEIDIKKCDHGCLHFLGNTWEGYVSDHNLKDCDFIVFEHIGHLHFNTHVFDETGCEKDFTTPEEDEEEEEESTSEDDEVECEHVSKSQFQWTLAKWNITQHYMNVPLSFARSNDMMQDRTVKLQNGIGDSWLVNLGVSKIEPTYRASYDRVMLSSLAAFKRDNNLKVGDTCIFKLVHLPSTRQEHVVMDVAFVRGRVKDSATLEEEDEESTSKDDVECIDEKDEENNDDDDDVPMEANYGSSTHQSSRFQITLAKWNIKEGWVCVPKLFAISNDMMQNRTVMLRNGTGDIWLAKLQVRNSMDANKHRICQRVVLTDLSKFLKENKLVTGDKCTFKLVDQPSRSRQDPDVVMDVVFKRRRR